jgi:hypothetical protein
METHTHTPAPWQIQFWNDSSRPSRRDTPVITTGKDAIAELFNLLDEEGEDRDAERLANARLIAAAPEMLAALKSLAIGLSPASVEMQRENLANLCRVCREIVKSTISKAKGGGA